MRVLIVRPAPDNTTTARRVAALGHSPVVVPLFTVSAIAWDPPDPTLFDAVAMTSANAARFAGPALARYIHLPLFAVGAATAAAATAAGFGTVETGASDADALAQLLTGRVLHFAGADHRPLASPADVVTRIVYAAIEADDAMLPDGDCVLVHSPRAGRALAARIVQRDVLHVVAISAAAASACGAGWRSVQVATVPQEDAMLACLAKLA